jgi:hypothetical protein
MRPSSSLRVKKQRCNQQVLGQIINENDRCLAAINDAFLTLHAIDASLE